jgi:hypothetical protein
MKRQKYFPLILFCVSCTGPQDGKIVGHISLSNFSIEISAESGEDCERTQDRLQIGNCLHNSDISGLVDCQVCAERVDIYQDDILIFRENIGQNGKRNVYTLLNKPPQTELTVEITGCAHDFRTKLTIPNEIVVEMGEPVWENDTMIYSWTPIGADIASIAISRGLSGEICWTDDDGSYSLHSSSRDYFGTSLTQMFWKQSIDQANYILDVYNHGINTIEQ